MSDILKACGALLLCFITAWIITWGIMFFGEERYQTSTFGSDTELIRAAQRECLNRQPAHSFSLVQTQGGYMVQCEPLHVNG